MNNHIAKEILSAYRSSGEDARDENFREALDQCEKDPEMKAWLADQFAFDRQAIRCLQTVHGPEEGKRSILAALPFEHIPGKRRRQARWWAGVCSLGMAAALAIGLVISNTQNPPHETDLAYQLAFLPFAQSALPFDFRSSDSLALVNWLQGNGHPVPASLPEPLLQAEAVGCKVFQDLQGNDITLICFQLEGKFVHLFAFTETTRAQLPHSFGWWSEENWNFYAFKNDNLVFATTSTPETFKKFS